MVIPIKTQFEKFHKKGGGGNKYFFNFIKLVRENIVV